MQRNNSQTLTEAINQLLQTHRLKTKLNETKIISEWETLMGKTIAKYTKHLYIKDKKLFLQIESAPLKQELSFAKEKIMEILNNEAGEKIIEEVVFY